MWAGIRNHQAVRYDGEWLPLGTSLWGRLVARSHVTGDHKGRPYGKRGRRGMMLEGEGRFENRPYGGGWVGFNSIVAVYFHGMDIWGAWEMTQWEASFIWLIRFRGFVPVVDSIW